MTLKLKFYSLEMGYEPDFRYCKKCLRQSAYKEKVTISLQPFRGFSLWLVSPLVWVCGEAHILVAEYDEITHLRAGV